MNQPKQNKALHSASRLAAQVRAHPGTVLTMAALAAAAMVVGYKTRQVERDHPPTGQFVEVDGVRLHYVERGQGQPLVLLHGNGTMTDDYAISGLLGLASTTYRVIVFDRPGFGYSARPRGVHLWTPTAQAALLHKALQQLGVERPVVVGHSWGTLVAIAMALDFPADVGSLVLMSGYYYPTARLDVAVAATPAIPLLGDFMRHTVSPLFGRLIWPMVIRRMFQPARVTPQFDDYPTWMSLRPSQLRASAAESGLMIPSAGLLASRYHELSMPLTIIAGEDDRIVDTWHQSVRLHDALPASQLQVVPGAGHMVHHVAPQQVMAAIDRAASGSHAQPARPTLESSAATPAVLH